MKISDVSYHLKKLKKQKFKTKKLEIKDIMNYRINMQELKFKAKSLFFVKTSKIINFIA